MSTGIFQILRIIIGVQTIFSDSKSESTLDRVYFSRTKSTLADLSRKGSITEYWMMWRMISLADKTDFRLPETFLKWPHRPVQSRQLLPLWWRRRCPLQDMVGWAMSHTRKMALYVLLLLPLPSCLNSSFLGMHPKEPQKYRSQGDTMYRFLVHAVQETYQKR